jgi:hypothetical protein
MILRMLVRQAGKVSGCMPGNILKSWTFANHLNWPVPPSSDNNRNICPVIDNPLQPLSNMPEASKFLVQKMK